MIYDIVTSILFLALMVVLVAVVVKYLTTPRQQKQCQHCAHVKQEHHNEEHRDEAHHSETNATPTR